MPAPVGKPVGWRSLSPNYGFVLAPRPNIFEAQLAFCQLVEFSPDLYIDCLIAAANPNPDSAGVDVKCANGTALLRLLVSREYPRNSAVIFNCSDPAAVWRISCCPPEIKIG